MRPSNLRYGPIVQPDEPDRTERPENVYRELRTFRFYVDAILVFGAIVLMVILASLVWAE